MGSESIPPWGPGSMDPPSPYPLRKSRKGRGVHRACADPEMEATSEGELYEPPRTLTNTLSTGRGVFCSDRPILDQAREETGRPGGGHSRSVGVWGRGGVLSGGPLPAAS